MNQSAKMNNPRLPSDIKQCETAQPTKNSLVDLAFFSFGGSFVAGITFVFAIQVFSSALSGGWGGNIFGPAVFEIMMMGVLAGTIIAFPFSIAFLRFVPLNEAARIVFGSVVVTIGTLTLVASVLSIPVAFVVMAISMYYCKTQLQLKSDKESNEESGTPPTNQ